jgi:hypothetical protein
MRWQDSAAAPSPGNSNEDVDRPMFRFFSLTGIAAGITYCSGRFGIAVCSSSRRLP